MTAEQYSILQKLAKDHNFGRGSGHANQVNTLSGKIYNGLVLLGLLNKTEQDERVLAAAALLHDIGLPKEPHNEIAFDFLADQIPGLTAANPLSAKELSAILYCVLWHRGATFIKRGTVDVPDFSYAKKMAAILRVADAFDRTLLQRVEDVRLRMEGERLIFTLFSKCPIMIEINRAKEKADLMKEAYALTKVSFEQSR